MRSGVPVRALLAVGAVASVLGGCASSASGPVLPPATYVASKEQPGEEYVIGPLDQLNVFVWRNPELSAKVQVRPDGRITTPLINDMPAVGKTPSVLAADMKQALGQYVKDPIVSVIVENFSGTYSQQVRVIGATEKPASIPYRANMTLLDAMIAVGGLNQYAAGNKAKLVRHDRKTGEQQEYKLQIADLLKKGDSSANVSLQPGDVIIIPESMF
ncbi:XrtA/PEP-CTERM system exopolysaccharide export protein [Sphingomonas sp. 2SG]|jgi:polysaccharide export outer membrane protein|uniref:XrtA/PEP-CTERM system exopolysaccharide export protein n=1 Tax=Sphingomonas sp. 2SG TaxID=2502201 RepID=UPI0010F8FCD9|nr:XrtA/PEP-CTERM system exopolysaccharide export protein [Sphingomonas sp. 2SG]